MTRTGAILGAAAALFLVMLAASSARAQVCTDTCDEYDQGRCVITRHSCTAPLPPPPAYGAIAFGRQSGAWGTSYHWASRARAESAAMRKCAAHGNDCEVMAWFRNECGAVASADGHAVFWAIGDGIGAARGAALAKCRQGGGRECTIAVSECSR